MLRELINTAEQRTLSLNQIRRDGGTQPREGIDWDHVKDMQQALADGAALPAISVIYDGADYWLWDGFHRWHAYANNGKLEIPVVISQGTQDDAQWESFAANQAHGLKRTPSEKERAIRGALKHPKSAGMSNMAIAKHLGVSDKTVAQYREKMELSSEIPKITTRTVERNGQTYQQNTANIGANRSQQPPAMLAVWELESTVREVLQQVYGGHPEPYALKDMRTGASNRAGRFWLICIQTINSNNFRLADLTQAINNVASQFEDQKRTAAVVTTTIAPTVAYVVPAEPDTWLEALQQRKYDTLDLRCNRLAAAMLPWAMEWTDDKERTWQDVAKRNPQHANSPFRQDVELEYKRRGIPIFEEATKLTILKLFNLLQMPETPADVVVNGDRPLPEWTAAAVGDGDGTVYTLRSTEELAAIDDNVDYPPAPEPVEATEAATPVSQRADYESDEWYTPQEYIDAAKAVMGAIDLDPASSEMAQTVVRAGCYLTRFDDGLAQVRWLHQRVWLNPPYSNPAPWIEKLVREHQAGPFCTEAIVLVNNATETTWFQLLLERFPVCLPARRLAFWRHDHANVGARQGQAFFYLGPNGAKFQEIFSQFGPILRRLS
ncbi:MAG: ParB N-terminal domain-containing protein [Caldilineaceae bacterium]|nr:ParB N-terminal domain-containing protein [Caldilineaceae bacterium]